MIMKGCAALVLVFILSGHGLLALRPLNLQRRGDLTLRHGRTQKFSAAVSLPDASAALTTAGSERKDATAKVVIVGGGPAGLLSAIMFAKKFPDQKVQVFERLPPPPSPTDESVWGDVAKFYLIGLGSRGQKALKKFGVWEDVKHHCVATVGRMDWAPGAAADEGVERIFTDRPYTTQVLPRDKLVGVLHGHILENYSQQVELNYGFQVTPLDFGNTDKTDVLLSVAKCDDEASRINPSTLEKSDARNKAIEEFCDTDNAKTISTEFLVAADGTARTIVSEIEREEEKVWEKKNFVERLWAEKPFKVTRYVDDNVRVYKTIPIKLPEEWRGDLNYSSRTKGSSMNFDALPADDKGNYCAVLLLSKDDDIAAADLEPKLLRQRMDDLMPQFSNLMDDDTVSVVAKKPPSFLPSFRYAGPRLHHKDSTVILGDSAHTVKPYFGLGANTALEDVQVLGEAIEKTTNLGEAARLYSKERAGESKALVQLSREFDRPGKLGFVTFVLPLILDSIFHRFLPKVFAPNTLTMLQREGFDFRGIRRRKLADRIGQTLVIGSVMSGIGCGLVSFVKLLARATGRATGTVVSVLVGAAVVVALLRKFSFFFLPGLAPADILAKTEDTTTGSESFLSEYQKRNRDENAKPEAA